LTNNARDVREEIDKDTGIIIRYNDKGIPYISIPIGNVPYEQGMKWIKDCKERFNGNRWLKVQHDHLQSLNFDLQTAVAFLEKELEKKREGVKTEDMNPLGLLNGGNEE